MAVSRRSGGRGSGSVSRRSGGGGSGSISRTAGGSRGSSSPVGDPTSNSFIAQQRGGSNNAVVTIGAGNARVDYTAKRQGVSGNSIRIRYVNPGGTAARSISVSGDDITVNLAVTAGVIDATETGANIRTAINANGPASALVTAALTAGSDGTGVVAAVGFTNLAGGRSGFNEGLQPGPHPAKAYG